MVVRILDYSGPQPAQKFTPAKFLGWVKTQLPLTTEVHSCYEAGPFGYGLHRALVALGVRNLVGQPVCLDERHPGVSHDKSDARELALRLDRYVAGNTRALATVRVPTPAEEQKRAASLVELYRYRWQIEVFFKQIKQTLQLADFLGPSANAVRWQVWIALLVYLLLRYLAFVSQWTHSFSRLFTLLRAALWKKWDALDLRRRYGTAGGQCRYCEFDPERGTGIVIMTNAAGGAELWRELIAVVSERLLPATLELRKGAQGSRRVSALSNSDQESPCEFLPRVIPRPRSLKAMGVCPSRSQPGDGEPRENRGRLRHCNGLQTPTATGPAPGRRERGHARSQDTGPVVLVGRVSHGAGRDNFSVKEKDEASRVEPFSRGFAECLHSPICRRVKVFAAAGATRWKVRSSPMRPPPNVNGYRLLSPRWSL